MPPLHDGGNRLSKVEFADPNTVRTTEPRTGWKPVPPPTCDTAHPVYDNRMLWYTEKLVTDRQRERDRSEPRAMSGREWTKYDSRGAGYQPTEPYGDFTVALDGSNDPLVTNVTRFIGGGAAAGRVGGLGTVAQQTVSGDATTYTHADLIGSVQLATDGSGAAGSSPATLVYTAFGEHVTAGNGSAARIGWPVTTGSIGATRYHYAGAYGYESGLLSLSGANSILAPITLQHLGARWYQPGIGRLVQRDPIGIEGGINAYAFCHNDPIAAVDPTGLSPGDKWFGFETLPGFPTFQRWFHRHYKPDVLPPGTDATIDDVRDAWDEWDSSGRPDGDGHRTRPERGPEQSAEPGRQDPLRRLPFPFLPDYAPYPQRWERRVDCCGCFCRR